MNIRYRVELSETERAELGALLGGGKRAAGPAGRDRLLDPARRASALDAGAVGPVNWFG
jgi:hypothetical protein